MRTETAAHELLTSLDMVQGAMDRMTPFSIGELLSSRLKSKMALQIFLVQLEGRCSRLRNEAPSQAVVCLSLDQKVSALGLLVNTHVTKWSPTAISADLDGYRAAVGNLFHAIRTVVIEAKSLPS